MPNLPGKLAEPERVVPVRIRARRRDDLAVVVETLARRDAGVDGATSR
jgi:hypothetical protein